MKHALVFFAVLTVSSAAIVGCAQRISASVSSTQEWHATFQRGAVAADHDLASRAGARMLELGGNAVDAAIAASFTLSVVRPYSCGIGGGGFMVIHLPNDPTHGYVHSAINYRETAYVDADYYQRTGKSSIIGGAAVAVPGTVAGLLYALEHYGTLDRSVVLQPAMDAAIDGFVVDAHYETMSQDLIKQFSEDPTMQTRFSFVWDRFLMRGRVRLGDRITNPAQHKALALIAEHGLDGFIAGQVGDAIIRAIRSTDGEMTIEQLRAYRPLEYPPLVGQVDGYEWICMPPPSSGGVTILQTMMILDAINYDFDHAQMNDEKTHQLIEALKHAFADRSMYLADPEFVDLPINDLLDESIIHERAQMITTGVHDPRHYGTANLIPTDGGTSHVSVIDPFGGAVACTETINLEFGSLVGVDEFGFILNNEMDDFTTIPGQPNAFGLVQSDRNLPAPGKRPLSSMSPTIVLDESGQIFAIAGASGGPRIITGTLQSIINAMGGMNAGDAVEAPRLHHQWLPNTLFVESELYPSLAARSQRGNWNQVRHADSVGNVQLIVRDRNGNGWQAASDPRKGGIPAGVN